MESSSILAGSIGEIYAIHIALTYPSEPWFKWIAIVALNVAYLAELINNQFAQGAAFLIFVLGAALHEWWLQDKEDVPKRWRLPRRRR